MDRKRIAMSAVERQEARLKQIVRATEELNRCVAERGNVTLESDKFLVQLGELDWECELHRLLFDEARYGKARPG
jgi:uncharacterized Rmd1/YagE family protein